MEKSQTPAKQKEQPNIHTGAETDFSKNYPLLTRTPVEHTPFEIVGNEQLGYKLTWGRFNLTDAMKTEDEVRYWQLDNRWDITMKLIHIYVENYFAFKELSQKDQQELFDQKDQ